MSRRMTTSEAINEARRCLNCARPLCPSAVQDRLPDRKQYSAIYPRVKRRQHRACLRDYFRTQQPARHLRQGLPA